MLLTFHSKASASITYFGDIAVTLLKMMGHSGTVPGALRAADIPAAAALLQQRLATTPEQQGGPSVQPVGDNTDAQHQVGLRLRASPLIQLLSAAARQGCDVTWEKGGPSV